MIPTKQQEWQDKAMTISRLTDKLGRGLDDGIRDMVIALNAFGITTVQSCEGHRDHGRPYPWITCASDEAKNLFQQSGEANARKDYQEAQNLKHRAEVLQGVLQGRLVHLLTRFYAHRHVAQERMLIVYARYPGTIILESQGAASLIGEASDAQERGLALCQEEMRAFAEFLKAEFLQSF